jgi:regulator of protease activity HflC (stomatin/prohibitin superfamily)
LISIGCSTRNNKGENDQNQEHNGNYKIDQTVMWLDMNGTNVRYKITYEVVSKVELSYGDIEALKSSTGKYLRNVLERYTYDDCVNKRGLVEATMIREITEKSKSPEISIESVVFRDLALPSNIMREIQRASKELKGFESYENVSSI